MDAETAVENYYKYKKGKGVKVEYVEAYKYAKLAVKKGALKVLSC